MAAGEHVRSAEVNGRMQIAALCPFCGARQGTQEVTRFVHIERGIKGVVFYYVACWMCGARGARDETIAGAFNNWNGRPTSSWTPLAASAFALPERTLMVYEEGRHISIVDWVNDEINSQVDIDLGRFRVCDLRERLTVPQEVAKVNDALGRAREKREDEYR